MKLYQIIRKSGDGTDRTGWTSVGAANCKEFLWGIDDSRWRTAGILNADLIDENDIMLYGYDIVWS